MPPVTQSMIARSRTAQESKANFSGSESSGSTKKIDADAYIQANLEKVQDWLANLGTDIGASNKTCTKPLSDRTDESEFLEANIPNESALPATPIYLPYADIFLPVEHVPSRTALDKILDAAITFAREGDVNLLKKSHCWLEHELVETKTKTPNLTNLYGEAVNINLRKNNLFAAKECFLIMLSNGKQAEANIPDCSQFLAEQVKSALPLIKIDKIRLCMGMTHINAAARGQKLISNFGPHLKNEYDHLRSLGKILAAEDMLNFISAVEYELNSSSISSVQTILHHMIAGTEIL